MSIGARCRPDVVGGAAAQPRLGVSHRTGRGCRRRRRRRRRRRQVLCPPASAQQSHALRSVVTPTGERSIVMGVFVCVCAFFCPRSYLQNYMDDLHQIFVHVFVHVIYGHCSVLLWRRYVLPVLSMTSYLLKSQGCWGRRRPAKAQCTRSFGLGYKLCAIIPVAGQRTHLTTFRALKVTSQVAATGAESAVYVCLVGHALRGCFIVSLVASIAPDV